MLGTGVRYILHISNSSIPQDGKTYRATMDADGIFRIYSHELNGNGNWSVKWAVPQDKCGPKGLCGINNGYCDENEQYLCTCPPGFVFINPEKKILGCGRNFTAESCIFKNEHTGYTLEEMQNTWLEQSTYSLLPPMTKEGCKRACNLEDCNCEAAFFRGQEC